MLGKTVLVVDDHAPTRLGYSAFLSECGYRVLQAGHGGEAIVQSCRELPDVVLLDLAMPAVSGIETAEWLRRYAGPARPRIIVVTGCAAGADRERMGDLCDDILEKPCDPHTVEARIRRFAQVTP
ncbi:response regulator [Longimicrobium sp.]|uniref:response regulator n=1 Tax=Longimicrobium sp. TaxID=2029185 RepID=UPI003B3B4CED